MRKQPSRKTKAHTKSATAPSVKFTSLQPTTRGGDLRTLIGKTLVHHEEEVSEARRDELLAEYPQPPYFDRVDPLGNGTYDVFIFV